MTLIQSLVAQIQSSLRDAGNDAWSNTDIHGAIYEAEKVITIFRPDATATDVSFPLAVGVKQSIAALNPAPHLLMSIKYNRAGDVDGRSVNRRSLSDLDSINPNWRSASSSLVIREYIFDKREPLIFYVSPPAATGAKVQLSYSAVPAEYGTVDGTTETTVSDVYEPMIVEWALYRLFGQDVEGSVNTARSAKHLQVFESMMGIKVDVDMLADPKNPEHKQ